MPFPPPAGANSGTVAQQGKILFVCVAATGAQVAHGRHFQVVRDVASQTLKVGERAAVVVPVVAAVVKRNCPVSDV